MMANNNKGVINVHKQYDIAAYIWPAYTGDEPRARIFWEEGMGEWQTVKNAVKKFDGHSWPRTPVWGYVNEADPYVMEMEIDAAADHGVNVFIYDWYWYDNRPFLEQCLNNGFLKARNHNRMKFYIMWANHDATYLWDKRSAHLPDTVVWSGAQNRHQFEEVIRRLIAQYFLHPCYYRIDQKPVFMIYDLNNLIRGLGGPAETKKALDWMQNEAVRAGLSGIHLQLVKWRKMSMNLSGVDGGADAAPGEIADFFGFSSVTNYQLTHVTELSRDYAEMIPDAVAGWEQIRKAYTIPYYPHVSVGWDNNPRFLDFKTRICKNNTPDNFEVILRHAKDFADRYNDVPLITLNSWNEWTETSYLEPDNLYGYGYLEAVKRVFCKE